MVKSWIDIGLTWGMIGACTMTVEVLKIKREQFYECTVGSLWLLQCSHQVIASDNINNLEMVDAPPTQEESSSVPHMVKCRPCEKNNQ